MDHVTVYQRTDGRWAWRRRAENGQVVATDGGQGYEDRGEAARMADELNPGCTVAIEEEPE